MCMESCNGCVYDLADRTESDPYVLCDIIDVCSSCKRGKIEEYIAEYPDLYRGDSKSNECFRRRESP